MADRALLQRLEVLSGSDGAACCVDLRSEAARLRPIVRERAARHKALADENRLLAASLVKAAGEMCACELQAALGLSHATVSHHMAQLVAAGVLAAEKRGKWTHYTITPQAQDQIP